jgi:hypothetical protein
VKQSSPLVLLLLSAFNTALTSLFEWRSSVKHTHTRQKTSKRDTTVQQGRQSESKGNSIRRGEETKDRNGFLFSEKWAADNNGEWCYGTVLFVFARRGSHLQKYRVKYDEGATMEAEDAHLELVEDDDDSGGEESGNEMGGSDAANSDGDTVAYEDDEAAIRRREEDEEGKVTDDSEGGLGDDNPGNLDCAEAALRN